MRQLWPESDTTPDGAELSRAELRQRYTVERSQAWLRANFVSTLDGAAEVAGSSRGVGGGASDQLVLGLLRVLADAVLVGAGTLRQEGYGGLRVRAEDESWRRAEGRAGQPTLVIVSSALTLDPGHRMFTEAPVRPIVLTHDSATAPAGLAAVAEILRRGHSTVDLAAGVAALRERGLGQLLTEGGPHLFADLLAADLVDELCLTVAPTVAGPGASRIAAGTPLPDPRRMRLSHVFCDPTGVLLTRYQRA